MPTPPSPATSSAPTPGARRTSATSGRHLRRRGRQQLHHRRRAASGAQRHLRQQYDGVEGNSPGTTGLKYPATTLGPTRAGTAPLGNSVNGINYTGNNGQLGGSLAGSGNLVSANGQYGIWVHGDGTSVAGNYIGTDAKASAALGNKEDGVHISGTNNQIGGLTLTERNVISGNLGLGLCSRSGQTEIRLVNFIGLNGAGTDALGNRLHGISVLLHSNNQIGGPASGERNVISGNGDCR